MNMRRRDFLKTASAATLSALAAGAPRLASANAPAFNIAPRADRVIVLWMAGGMAHTDTFDPKQYTPFEVGIDPAKVLSTFPAVDTIVDGVKFSEGLEKIGQIMDRGTICNTYTAGDLGFIQYLARRAAQLKNVVAQGRIDPVNIFASWLAPSIVRLVFSGCF